MSYIRGDYYAYIIGPDDKEEIVLTVHHKRSVNIPLPVFDEIVVMRYAQLVKEGKVDETENRAVEKWVGNFGCQDLATKKGIVPEGDMYQ